MTEWLALLVSQVAVLSLSLTVQNEVSFPLPHTSHLNIAFLPETLKQAMHLIPPISIQYEAESTYSLRSKQRKR